MLDQLCDENAGITASRLPSNLKEIPRVSEKYEMNSFFLSNAQYRANLKTIEILKNSESGQGILNMNPGFFSGVSERANEEIKLKDPFSDILEKQNTWQSANKIG